jgi:hypothetical protein
MPMGRPADTGGPHGNGTTLNNGDYGTILNVLQNPSSGSYTQYIDLAQADTESHWGAENFQYMVLTRQ